MTASALLVAGCGGDDKTPPEATPAGTATTATPATTAPEGVIEATDKTGEKVFRQLGVKYLDGEQIGESGRPDLSQAISCPQTRALTRQGHSPKMLTRC